MDTQLEDKLAAVRASKSLGCSGAHLDSNGNWLPCSSTAEYIRLSIKRDDPTKILPSDIEDWNSRRSVKGRKKKKRFEKLRERGVLGINTLPGGGLVSAPISTAPAITMASAEDENINEKAVIAPMSPRDTDVDVFTDIESARARSRQLGCIGVSRRVSRSGKTVWMPCTNMSDYARVSGTTALGRRYQQQQRNRQIEGAVRTVLTNRGLTRKKTITDEIQEKALGRTLKRGARFATETFDPNAIDGDNDGLVQDSTAFERPNVGAVVPNMPSTMVPRQQSNSALDGWYRSLSEKERVDRFGPPIEAMAMLKDSDVREIMSQVSRQGLRSAKQPPSINNPRATDKNPYADLGGRQMGKIIIDRVKPEHRNKNQQTMYFVGGTVGAGKDTVVDHLQSIGIIPTDDAAARIDPDFIKAGLPGYNDGQGASVVHQQSRLATDYVIRDANRLGMDTIVLGTGKRDEHPAGQKRAGNRVVGHFVYAPRDVASKRVQQRNAAGGRQIRDMSGLIADQLPYHISRMLDKNSLDEFYLWDNSGDMATGFKPKLIAEKKPGSKLKIYDKQKFDDFAGGSKWSAEWEKKMNANDTSLSGGTLSSRIPQDSKYSWDFNNFGSPSSGMRSERTKPQFPRKPPAYALSGKAEDTFGDAETWEEFQDIMNNTDIVFIDYETTGLMFDEFNESAGNGEPLQIGAVRMRGNKVIDRINIYMDPAMQMSEWEPWSRDNLVDMDGKPYTDAFFDNKPSIAEAHKLLADFVGDSIVGMQNAVFDNEVLEKALKESGIEWRPAGILDTKEIADFTLPKWTAENPDGPTVTSRDGTKKPSSSLKAITEYLGVELGEKHHSADYDAIATGEVLSKIVNGAIKNGWSTKLLDKKERKAKVIKNQERFEKQVAEFRTAKEEWLAQQNPADGGMRSRRGNELAPPFEENELRELVDKADEKTERLIAELKQPGGQEEWDKNSLKGTPYTDLISEKEAKKAEDSVSIKMSTDGMPVLRAEPHPVLRLIFGDSLDGHNNYEIPKREVVQRIIKTINNNYADVGKIEIDKKTGVETRTLSVNGKPIARVKKTDGQFVDKKISPLNERWIIDKILDPNYQHLTDEEISMAFISRANIGIGTIGGSKIIQHLSEKIQKLLKPNKERDDRSDGFNLTNLQWAQTYVAALHEPRRIIQTTTQMSEFEIHDIIGHFGFGNSFDRHGEIGNSLGMLSIIDELVENGVVSKGEAQIYKRTLLAAFETSRLSDGRFDEPDDFGFPISTLAGKAEYDKNKQEPLRMYVGDWDKDVQRPLQRAALAQGSGMRSQRKATDANDTQLHEALRVENRDRAFTEYTRNGMRSISSRITAGMSVRGKKPKRGPDSSQQYKSVDEIIDDAIVGFDGDIRRVLASNPYTKGRKKAVKLLEEMGVDPEKQTAVRVLLRRALKDSPALLEFAREFGLPPIVITDREPRVNSFSGVLEAGISWNRRNIAAYLNYEGFIAINPNIGNMELVGVGNDRRTPEYVIRHEIGHAIDAMSIRNKDAAKAKKKAFAEYIERVQEYLKTAPESEKDMFYTGQLEARPDNNVPSELLDDELALAKSISDYATINRHEYIAEAFAHITAPPSEAVRKLRREHYEMLSEFLGIDIERLLQFMR